MARYVIRGGRAGFERLQLLASLRLPETRVVLDRIGLAPGWRCADLGTGSGDFALVFAEWAGPSGQVDAFDMDEEKLALAEAEAERRGLEHVRFERADLTAWSAESAYDLVYCGLVLQHLTDPADLIRRAWKAVRPGGYLLVEDADFAGLHCYPPNDGHAFWVRSYQEVLRLRGGDPEIGRKLARLFLDAGLPQPEVRLVQRADLTGAGKRMAIHTVAAIADALVAEGVATEAEVVAALAELTSYTDDPSTLIADARIYQVWAQRPAEPGKSET